MRILTVRQPWAWAIIHGEKDGEKDVENRTRNIAGSYRGPVAIHAGASLATFDSRHAELWPYNRASHPLGAIIGVVDLVGVHESRLDGCGTRKGTARLGELIPLCSEWADPWAHHLVLANQRPLAEPIPYKGALGLRELPDDVAQAIWGQS